MVCDEKSDVNWTISRQAETEMGRQQANRQAGRRTCGQRKQEKMEIDRQENMETGRQTGKQENVETDRQ